MDKKLKDSIGKIAWGCISAYAIHGIAVIFLSGALEYYSKTSEKRIPIIKEINHIEYVLNNHPTLLSEESKERLETEETNLLGKLSDLEKELAPYKEKSDKAMRRAVNPLTYLTELS